MNNGPVLTITDEMCEAADTLLCRIFPASTQDERGSALVGVFMSMMDIREGGNVSFEFEQEPGVIHRVRSSKPIN